MKLTRNQLLELNRALSSPGLKVKTLTTENIVKLLKLTSSVKNEILLLIDGENLLAEEFKVDLRSESAMQNQDLVDKMNKFQDDFMSSDLLTNFLPEAEFIEYIREQDTSIGSVLLNYLMKDGMPPVK